jgi:hypothetical protein
MQVLVMVIGVNKKYGFHTELSSAIVNKIR